MLYICRNNPTQNNHQKHTGNACCKKIIWFYLVDRSSHLCNDLHIQASAQSWNKYQHTVTHIHYTSCSLDRSSLPIKHSKSVKSEILESSVSNLALQNWSIKTKKNVLQKIVVYWVCLFVNIFLFEYSSMFVLSMFKFTSSWLTHYLTTTAGSLFRISTTLLVNFVSLYVYFWTFKAT